MDSVLPYGRIDESSNNFTVSAKMICDPLIKGKTCSVESFNDKTVTATPELTDYHTGYEYYEEDVTIVQKDE